MTSSRALNRKVSKSTLSMFLRTRCDKELYLSLHDNRSISSLGLPEPVKRPGIGTLSIAGRELELERNDQIVRLFGSSAIFNRGANKFNDIDLSSTLLNLQHLPSVVIQPKFSVDAIKQQILQNIGVSTLDAALIPPMADFIPDLLLIQPAQPDDQEVLVNGSRTQISPIEQRSAIKVFDIKHTSESNPSYCAEIAMYSLMLANWLDSNPVLSSRYYVSANAYLWTLKKQGCSAIDEIEGQQGVSVASYTEALIKDSEVAYLRYYLATVRQFFEDVARVIRIGDASPDAWKNLDWHVVSSCSNCDWLGDKRHLGSHQQTVIDSDRGGYCITLAADSGHLSLIPGITRGAKKTLELNSIFDAATLAGSLGHPALQQHTMLKKEATILPAKTKAIINSQLNSDPKAVIASLAGYANLQLFLTINFDASAGLLTGMSISGLATSYTRGQTPLRFPTVPFVVDEKSLDAEWIALEGLLSQIADNINRAEQLLGEDNLRGQIHIWEQRQFTELCNAIGRHLPRVLNLSERKAKALVWIFPPEELIGTPKSVEASTVVIVEEVVRRMVFTPTPHVITLFDTAEAYSNLQYPPVVRDSYFREYLSNGIPRERIYEIWSNAPRIKRGPNVIPRNTLISDYSEALKKQSQSLQTVCDKLRDDYRGQFKASSPRIPTAIPRGTPSVAFDAKLWIWWDDLNFLTSQLEAHFKMVLEGKRLEATYEAIILNNGQNLGNGRFSFDVEATSAESKFKTDSSLTVGKIGRPGFPLENINNLIASTAQPYLGDQSPLNMPLWSVLEAKLINFDRVNLKLLVEFTYWRDPALALYIVDNCNENLLDDIFLLESKSPRSYNWANTSTEILREIGNPPIAKIDMNAATAMGITPPKRQTRSGRNTPISEILWDAATLFNTSRLSVIEANNIADVAAVNCQLNQSQKQAVKNAAEKALTVIWGPPGTGKTKTLSAFIYAEAQNASISERPLKILITGPTYKAVEQIMERTHKLLVGDAATSCTLSFGYSAGRGAGRLKLQSSSNLIYSDYSFDNHDMDYLQCLANLSGSSGVHIVGAQIRQARRLSKDLSTTGKFINDVFDVVLIDESSQVPVSHALSALCGLKSDGKVVIAGDSLQMPPITAVEAPADASYLVGSIQTYLLERDFGQPITPCILDRNYRSSRAIVEFAKTIGYPSTLDSEFPDTALTIVSQFPDQSQFPVTLPWCDQYETLLSPENSVAALLHEDEISSQGNHYEARLVAGIVWTLRQTVGSSLSGRGILSSSSPTSEEFWGECVGIVTPHRAQRALVIKELEALFPMEKNLIDEAVDTVERFQGGERHCIIVTYGVADVDVISGEEAFLLQLERTNVAISRAMGKCIVVMPKSLAKHIPEDKKALETAHALKDYLDDFCNIRVDCEFSDSQGVRSGQIRVHG